MQGYLKKGELESLSETLNSWVGLISCKAILLGYLLGNSILLQPEIVSVGLVILPRETHPVSRLVQKVKIWLPVFWNLCGGNRLRNSAFNMCFTQSPYFLYKPPLPKGSRCFPAQRPSALPFSETKISAGFREGIQSSFNFKHPSPSLLEAASAVNS